MFEDFAQSIFGGDAPKMDALGKFNYDKFDWSKAFKQGTATSTGLAKGFNESFMPGLAGARSAQLTGRNNLAEQLLSGGLSDAQRNEINGSNAELSWLGYGGGSGSSMDSLRGLKFRTDAILGNQLQGANLAGQNINLANGLLIDPKQVLGGYLGNEQQDYNFNRSTEYDRFQTNHNIQNQNKVIDYTNSQNDFGPAFARLAGSGLDFAAQAALSYFSGGTAKATPPSSAAPGGYSPSGFDDSNYKFGIQPGQSSFGFV